MTVSKNGFAEKVAALAATLEAFIGEQRRLRTETLEEQRTFQRETKTALSNIRACLDDHAERARTANEAMSDRVEARLRERDAKIDALETWRDQQEGSQRALARTAVIWASVLAVVVNVVLKAIEWAFFSKAAASATLGGG